LLEIRSSGWLNAAMIRGILSAGVEIYVNINNHYEGSAPRTIARLQTLLEQAN